MFLAEFAFQKPGPCLAAAADIMRVIIDILPYSSLVLPSDILINQ